jgi:hypothetical protein
MYCFAEEPEPETELTITGSGAGCEGDGEVYTLDVETWVIGDASSVSAMIVEVSTGLQEVHQLTEVSTDPATGEVYWERVLSAEETKFANCFDRELTYVITAVDPSGGLVCDAIGANPENYPEC